MDIDANDPQAYHEFERQAWQGLAQTYQASFGRLTRQAVEPLLDAVGAGPGVRLLEIACGPGNAAGAAAKRGAASSAIDFTPGMVAVAKSTHSGIDVAVANAQALPFGEGSFDAVVCGFGMHHFPHPGVAVSEVHRVLAASGRFAFTLWSPVEAGESASLRALIQGATAAHGDPGISVPAGPPEAELADPRQCREWLASRGFGRFERTRLDIEGKWQSPADVLHTVFNGMGRTKAIIEAQGASARARIEEAICQSAIACEREGAIRIPTPAILVRVERP